jgi:hypothetical protein
VGLLQIGVEFVRVDPRRDAFVRVEEDRVVWARLSAEFIDEGFLGDALV